MGFPSGYLDMTMNVIQTSLHHGYRKAAAQATGDSERQKIIFLSALNCADNATDYISRLTSALKSEVQPLISGKSDHEKEKLENCLTGFPALAARLQSILEQGILDTYRFKIHSDEKKNIEVRGQKIELIVDVYRRTRYIHDQLNLGLRFVRTILYDCRPGLRCSLPSMYKKKNSVRRPLKNELKFELIMYVYDFLATTSMFSFRHDFS